jgi:hypothetical protein
MQEKSRLMTREQYLEMLIEASCWEASAMESGFMSWCERHVPAWRRLGQDETWIRQRIETAQITRGLHRTLKEQGLTVLEIRQELRRAYAASPELYDLARTSTPERLRYRGDTGDLRQRYTLRVLIRETEKLTYEAFRRWCGLPMTGPDSVFRELPDQVRVMRDLSTVEVLELLLAMSASACQLFGAPQSLSQEQIAMLMEERGKELRAAFVARYGYRPEESATPYVPSRSTVPRITRPTSRGSCKTVFTFVVKSSEIYAWNIILSTRVWQPDRPNHEYLAEVG